MSTTNFLNFHEGVAPADARLASDSALRGALILVKEKELLTGTAIVGQERKQILIKLAQTLLPDPRSSQSLSFSFGVARAQKDMEASELKELADHISAAANGLEQQASMAMSKSTSFPEWNNQLAHLGDQYSFVIEAAQTLLERGVMSLRLGGELSSLLEEPNPNAGRGVSDMFTKACAIYAERVEEVKNNQSMRMV